MRSNSHRKQGVSVAQAADTDWRAIELPLLGMSGELAHVSYRLDAGGVAGSLEIKVIDGAYDPTTITPAELALVPDEDTLYHETSIALSPSATVAAKTNIIASVNEAAVYDRRGGRGYSYEDRTVMLAYRGDGILAGNLSVVFRAINTGR